MIPWGSLQSFGQDGRREYRLSLLVLQLYLRFFLSDRDDGTRCSLGSAQTEGGSVLSNQQCVRRAFVDVDSRSAWGFEERDAELPVAVIQLDSISMVVAFAKDDANGAFAVNNFQLLCPHWPVCFALNCACEESNPHQDDQGGDYCVESSAATLKLLYRTHAIENAVKCQKKTITGLKVAMAGRVSKLADAASQKA